MSGGRWAAAEPTLELDLDQELILLRRFEDAVASLVHGNRGSLVGADSIQAHQEFERTWRIATNMRGHIR
jgi:hypothetical protein